MEPRSRWATWARRRVGTSSPAWAASATIFGAGLDNSMRTTRDLAAEFGATSAYSEICVGD